jgi:hypothetical protein
MLLCPHQGLCNRLENAFAFINDTRARGETISLIWQNNDECSGNFHELFHPILGLEIVQIPVPKDHKQMWVPMTKESYTILGNDLKPTEWVQCKVDWWTGKMNNDFIAVHVRHTDLLGWAEWAYGLDIRGNEVFYDFIDSYPSDTKIFLATDNQRDQNLFIKRYGERVFFEKMVPNQAKRRKTNLRDAVIDMFVCAKAKAFLGTRTSSFSKAILALRKEVDKCFDSYYNPPRV